MDWTTLRFPRVLEEDGTARELRRVLPLRKARLWSGGLLEVPIVEMNGLLAEAIQRACLRRRIRLGLEAIAEKLTSEERGLARIVDKEPSFHGERISRLILFSRDGAERLYRHLETLLLSHTPRLMGCRIDVDAVALGTLVTGRERPVKVILVEHKQDVAAVLKCHGATVLTTDKGAEDGPPISAPLRGPLLVLDSRPFLSHTPGQHEKKGGRIRS
jgi:hypothetical protein